MSIKIHNIERYGSTEFIAFLKHPTRYSTSLISTLTMSFWPICPHSPNTFLHSSLHPGKLVHVECISETPGWPGRRAEGERNTGVSSALSLFHNYVSCCEKVLGQISLQSSSSYLLSVSHFLTVPSAREWCQLPALAGLYVPIICCLILYSVLISESSSYF